MSDKLDKKLDKHLPAMDSSRRAAIKRIALGTVFAVPAVMSFSMNSANANPVGVGCFASNTATNLSPAEGNPAACAPKPIPH